MYQLLVDRKTIMCVDLVELLTLLNSLVSYTIFSVDLSRLSTQTIMSSVNRNSFISSFVICMLFISLCCHLILLAKTSGARAHRNDSRPSFVTNLRKKALRLSPLSIKLAPPHTALSVLGGGGGLAGPHWQ